jgi:hypothetical protein
VAGVHVAPAAGTGLLVAGCRWAGGLDVQGSGRGSPLEGAPVGLGEGAVSGQIADCGSEAGGDGGRGTGEGFWGGGWSSQMGAFFQLGRFGPIWPRRSFMRFETPSTRAHVFL